MNGYLVIKHFSDSLLPHFKFKMTAAAALLTYKLYSMVETGSLLNNRRTNPGATLGEDQYIKEMSTCAVTICLGTKE